MISANITVSVMMRVMTTTQHINRINIFSKLMVIMLYSLAIAIAMYATVTSIMFLAIAATTSLASAASHRQRRVTSNEVVLPHARHARMV